MMHGNTRRFGTQSPSITLLSTVIDEYILTYSEKEDLPQFSSSFSAPQVYLPFSFNELT